MLARGLVHICHCIYPAECNYLKKNISVVEYGVLARRSTKLLMPDLCSTIPHGRCESVVKYASAPLQVQLFGTVELLPAVLKHFGILPIKNSSQSVTY